MRPFGHTLLATVAAILVATPLVGADRLCKINAMCTPNVLGGSFPNPGMAPPLVQVNGAQWESKSIEPEPQARRSNGHPTIECIHLRLTLSYNLLYLQTVDGWDVYKERVQLNGNSTVAGWPTPNDPDVPPLCPCPLDDCPLSGTMDFDATIESANPPPTGSDTYIDFYSSGNVASGFGYVRKQASGCAIPLVCVYGSHSFGLCITPPPLHARR